MRMLAHRIADPWVLRLIERWLEAGVLESGQWRAVEAGTPQGSGISPVLAIRPVSGATRAFLIVGGAGGVGSIAIQLARQLTDLAVVATASRPETARWAKDMGAHHVVDHKEPLAPQVGALGLGAPAFVFATVPSGGLFADLAELIAPQGRLALINLRRSEQNTAQSVGISVAGKRVIVTRRSGSLPYDLKNGAPGPSRTPSRTRARPRPQ